MTLNIAEIISKTNDLSTFEERLKFLSQHKSNALRVILQYALHPDSRFEPGLVIPTKKNVMPQGISNTTLYKEYSRMYVLLQRTDTLRLKRKQEILTTIYEGIGIDEAALLTIILEGKFKESFSNVDETLVNDVFPGSIPDTKEVDMEILDSSIMKPHRVPVNPVPEEEEVEEKPVKKGFPKKKK
jgi:hypothetical protein